MNIESLKEAAVKLEAEATLAVNAGYVEARCFLDGQTATLINKAKASEIKEAVKVEGSSGIFCAFSETRLGECLALEAAWRKFRWLVEDRDSDPAIVADKLKNPKAWGL